MDIYLYAKERVRSNPKRASAKTIDSIPASIPEENSEDGRRYMQRQSLCFGALSRLSRVTTNKCSYLLHLTVTCLLDHLTFQWRYNLPTPYLCLIVLFHLYLNWIHSHLITNNITVPIIHQNAKAPVQYDESLFFLLAPLHLSRVTRYLTFTLTFREFVNLSYDRR
eukprot:sb/3472462/